MVWFCVWQVVSTLVELIRLGCRSESAKDLEILLLRHQLAIYERKQERAPHLSRGEKLMLVVLATRLKDKTNRTIKGMGDVIRIVKPATLFGWHRALVGTTLQGDTVGELNQDGCKGKKDVGSSIVLKIYHQGRKHHVPFSSPYV
jgi:hypothetical protein